MLAKAAALNAPLPPLAPARANSASRAAPLAIVPRTAPGAGKGDPRDSGVTGSIASARPAPAVVVAAPPHANAKLAAPFGAMPVDAFRTASATTSDLRYLRWTAFTLFFRLLNISAIF